MSFKKRSAPLVKQAVHCRWRQCHGEANGLGTGMVLVDMRGLNQMVSLRLRARHPENSRLIVLAGAYRGLYRARKRFGRGNGDAQKQTGADNLSIGGTLAANADGRGLTMQPFVSNIQSFTLIDQKMPTWLHAVANKPRTLPLGDRRLWTFWGRFFGNHTAGSETEDSTCRRDTRRSSWVNEKLFSARIHSGFLYGDFQFAIEKCNIDFLHKGVFSCYRPVDPSTPMPERENSLSDESWRDPALSRARKAEKDVCTTMLPITCRLTASCIGQTHSR